MPTLCCVPNCKERGGHLFPFSDSTLVKEWLVSIRRSPKNFTPTKYSRVCREHFTENDYKSSTTYGTVPLQRKLKPCAVPSVFPWSKAKLDSDLLREERVHKRMNVKEQEPDIEHVVSYLEVDDRNILQSVEPHSTLTTVSTQTPQISKAQVSTQTLPMKFFSLEHFLNDNEGLHFYCGLENIDTFRLVLSFLGPAQQGLNYYGGQTPNMPHEDQFFLTLIRLRRYKPMFELGRLFRVSEQLASSIFVTWVNFMFHMFKEVNWWPIRDLVSFYMPEDFRAKFASTRVILDGTESPIQKPADPLAQQGTFSTYKNRNTVKVVAGTSPGGLFSYLSPAYGGSTSDRQIIERSNILHMCDPGDSVMVDKGFSIEDLAQPQGVAVNIPAFFRKQNKIHGNTVIRDRKIASKRVHVEREIGLAKTFKILTQPLNRTDSALATRIFTCCFYLCNFRKNIVSKRA